MAYRLSREAQRDVIDIYLWGSETFGEDQAERYHTGLERTFTFLAEFPLAARERAELRQKSRVYPYQSHLIFYRLDGDDIFIQRVRHSREDWLGHSDLPAD